MIELEIDNQKIEVPEGTMIIKAADAAGVPIPRFCYHDKLSIAANCRMCLVEVDKSKKPVPACATPVMPGMKVFTKSKMALDAQRSVMEFLLINHPLDCPICDQGGECELQDLSLGYGNDISRYAEGKRSVFDENLGPLISTEMTRCIQCTRCVRFGSEIAGMPELGATQRGENLEITTYVHRTLKSELSGNIIDLCPVGALTSKPFRFKARAWELKQHPSVAPHDCIGSNLFVHTRGYEYTDYRRVMRVVPRENEKINETWISDRDRFSYEAVNSTDRLLTPKIKRESQWVDVDWTTALNYVVEKWRSIVSKEGSHQLAALASPNSTLEEFYLLQKLFRNLGSNNLDHRLRQLDFSQQENFPTHPSLGIHFREMEELDLIFIVGSDPRREQPLGCHHIRKAALRGATVICLNPVDYDFNFKLSSNLVVASDQIPQVLKGILKSISTVNKSKLKADLKKIEPTENEIEFANRLLKSKRGLIILGNHASRHPNASLIRALCEEIVAKSELTLGTFSEGANAAGAWLAGMLPHRGAGGIINEKPGLTAQELLSRSLKSYLLLNIEPELDCAQPKQAIESLTGAEFVVVMTPFLTEAQEKYANVILPIAPIYETPGTFINASDSWQQFAAVTRPLGEAKPAWKVLRVLGNLFEFEGFDYIKPDQVTAELKELVESMPQQKRALAVTEALQRDREDNLTLILDWSMYHIDNHVRRAKPLQEWSEENYPVVIRINSQIANQHDIQSGEMVAIVQDEAILNLPVQIDDSIAGSYVIIPAGIQETAGFGENMGPVRLLRGLSK